MGYYVAGSGAISFKEDIASEMKNLFKERLNDIEYLAICVETDNEISIRFYDYHYRDQFDDFLPEIADKVDEGYIECDGQDGEFWKWELENGKWKEFNGIKTYEKYGREM